MRFLPLARPALVALALIPVACAAPEGSENVVRAGQPIQGGTVDMGDPAVVAILVKPSSGGMSICTGTLGSRGRTATRRARGFASIWRRCSIQFTGKSRRFATLREG